MAKFSVSNFAPSFAHDEHRGNLHFPDVEAL